MENVVTINKVNAKDGLDVFTLLSPLTLSVKEKDQSFVFIPLPGKLLSMLELLKSNNVPHEVINQFGNDRH